MLHIKWKKKENSHLTQLHTHRLITWKFATRLQPNAEHVPTAIEPTFILVSHLSSPCWAAIAETALYLTNIVLKAENGKNLKQLFLDAFNP